VTTNHGVAKLLDIIHAIDRVALALVQVVKVFGVLEAKLLAQRTIGARKQLVEDVKVSLSFGLVDDARLFEQVCRCKNVQRYIQR